MQQRKPLAQRTRTGWATSGMPLVAPVGVGLHRQFLAGALDTDGGHWTTSLMWLTQTTLGWVIPSKAKCTPSRPMLPYLNPPNGIASKR